MQKERGALRIVALDARAVSLGLRIGMTLMQARVLASDIAMAETDPAADAAWLDALAAVCEMFTPLVALRGADGLVLDIAGCAHLFGGEAGLRQAARKRLQALGAQTQAAMACTPEAAWALARHCSGDRAQGGDEEALLRALPIAALEQEDDITLALGRAGFRTLEDLAERPSQVLVARFGETVANALRRVLGREDIRITPLRPPPEIMAERHFPDPLGAMESLLDVLGRLASDVMAALERRAEGGRIFEASFFRADGAVRRLVIETAQGTRDANSLARLMRLKIEALADPLDPGFGFDALRLAVMRSEPLHDVQRDLAGKDETADPERAKADLVNRLMARFGRENVRRFVACDTHDPVRAGGTASFLSASASACASASPRSSPWPEPEAGQPPARPLTLFAYPQPIDVLAEVPDSPPVRFRWRRVMHEVTRAEGPERIAPEWWRDMSPMPATRDYYRVEDAEGHRFWIFREGLYEDALERPRWYVHGLFA